MIFSRLRIHDSMENRPSDENRSGEEVTTRRESIWIFCHGHIFYIIGQRVNHFVRHEDGRRSISVAFATFKWSEIARFYQIELEAVNLVHFHYHSLEVNDSFCIDSTVVCVFLHRNRLYLIHINLQYLLENKHGRSYLYRCNL